MAKPKIVSLTKMSKKYEYQIDNVTLAFTLDPTNVLELKTFIHLLEAAHESVSEDLAATSQVEGIE